MKKLLTISNVKAGYAGKPVIEDMTLHVNQGELVALLGHNGAGKTTLLKIIYGLLTPMQGRVEISGKMVYVPQGVRVFSTLTVKENILIAVKDKVIPESILTLFPSLRGRESELAGNLSGGEQQMVALARAMVQKPEILLLDEPSLGLSPKLVKEVFEKLEIIRQQYGYTILIVEHNIRSLSSIVDRAYVLEKGLIKKELSDLSQLGMEII